MSVQAWTIAAALVLWALAFWSWFGTRRQGRTGSFGMLVALVGVAMGIVVLAGVPW